MTGVTLQEHMQACVGVSIANPVIDGCWHSGRACDGKRADKISYVAHQLAKGLLVRYRDHREPDTFHVFRGWEENRGALATDEFRQNRAEAIAKAREAQARTTHEASRLLACLQSIMAESIAVSIRHPYLEQKKIVPVGVRQAIRRYRIVPASIEGRAQYITPADLLVPVFNHAGALQGIQQITAEGRKLARGSFKAGLMWVGGGLGTGEVCNRLYIAEGYATAVSIHMRTRNPVIVAFSTANLLSTGHFARQRYPGAEIIFAVDNDVGSFIQIGGERVENPGKYYAQQAALAINAAVITPPVGGSKADWNDWHVSQISK